MTRGRRPSIFQIGHVHDDGTTVTVTGWGLGLCAAACDCHRHPTGRHLTLLTTADGHLGLVSYRACDCCQPWTPDELAAVVRDLADIAALGSPA